MRAQPVDLIGGFYKDDSLPWSCQDTVNWLPVQAEVSGTRSVAKLSTPPGLKPWLTVGSGPVRGMHDLEGGRFVVSGQTLCRINPNNSVDPIGTIPGVGRVQMTHNQFKTGYQLLVENGQGGGGYVYDTNTSTLTKIADEGYPGSISSDYLDQYILGVEPQGRFWFHSNLADATDYNTLDRYEAESAPDKIVGLAANASEVVVFGERTTEFFFNSGAATGTFQNRRSSITKGCASRHTIQKLDNSVFWLGNDGVVYRLENGYAARPVSTRPLEKAISGYNWPEAVAYVWEDRGHKVYYLTFPDGQTFGYDVITGLWHRRESFGLNRWRLSHIISWGRDWFGGDFQSGRIWQLDWDYIMEGQDPLVRRRVSPVAADNQSAMTNPMAELVFDVGRGPETVALSFPNAITINGIPPSTLVGLTYPTFSFTGSGGAAPYTFSIASGSLPPGLSMSGTGAISGLSNAGGSYRFTVRAYDSRGAWTEADYSILVIAGVIGLATPDVLFTGSYESLVPSAPISAPFPAQKRAFDVSPSTAFAAVGIGTSPFLRMYAINPARTAYAEIPVASPPSGTVYSLGFNADGSILAVSCTDGGQSRLVIYRLEAGAYVRKSFTAIGSPGHAMRWSPTRSQLVVWTTAASPDFGFRVFNIDAAAGTVSGSFSPTQARQSASCFAFSPDGNYLVVSGFLSTSPTVYAIGETSISYLTTATGLTNTEIGVSFSGNGQWIYFASTAAAPASQRVIACPFNSGVIGSPSYPLASVPFSIYDLNVAPAGDYLAISRSDTTGPGLAVYKANGSSLTISPDQPSYAFSAGAISFTWTP